MSEERNLIPTDPAYISALGLAAYAFARCEWQVVWCCEKIQPGTINKIMTEEMTAGVIARHFANLVRNMPKSKKRDELSDSADEFSKFVDKRNKIIHGKPCTAPNGEQRLSAEAIIETIDLEDAADAFTVCGSKLNSIFYGFFADICPEKQMRGLALEYGINSDIPTTPLDTDRAKNCPDGSTAAPLYCRINFLKNQ